MRLSCIVGAVCVAVYATAAPPFAVAQETINAASVSGRVVDTSDAVVPGVEVVARHTETNVKAETVTDQEGRFRFPYLRVGPYEISVSLRGFVTETRPLILTVGAAFELPFTLKMAAIDANYEVSAQAIVLEAARSQIAATVSQDEVRTLPMNGRNFLDLALLAPGVSPTNVASTQLFAETSAVPGPGISVGSQRNFSNNFIVDGLSANDDAAGLSGVPYAVDAVEQFQVVTSGGHAELGRALGGYVNVVTKSGTNTTRGDLYAYFRDDAFNAPNALSGTTLPMHQDQFGGSLGGPIAREKTFYFANVERRQLDQVGLTTISAANVDAINARLRSVGYPGAALATGVFANPVDSSNVLAKIEQQPTGGVQLGIRYSQYTVSSSNSRGAGGLNASSASASLDNADRTLAFTNTLTLSPRTVNETRAQYTFGDLQAPATDQIGPAVTIQGVATFGTASGSPTRRVNRLYEVVDNLSHQAGAHALRVGVDFLFNDDTITYPRSIRGAYTFSSLPNFLAGAYNNAGFTQTFGASAVSQTNPNLGIYAQDEWKVGSTLTINAGVRYDLQWLETIATDTNNVSPRAGFAWSPTESRNTVIRGSAGLFYDRVPLRALANALLSAGNTSNVANLRQIGVSLSPAQTGAPVFPGTLSSITPSVTLPNLTTMDPRMENAYSRQASAEIEQRLGQRSTISVGYQYLRGVDLIVSVNQNVPSCVAAGTNNGCRPNLNFANNSQYSPHAESSYQGLHVSFVQRPVRWGFYRVSYTLSKAMANVGEFFFSSPIDPFDLQKDWGRSDDDQRHRFVVNGAATVYGFQLGGMLQAYSALPFNITSGATTVQGTTGRPIVNGAFIPRNAGTGPSFFSLNARVSRVFALGQRTRAEGIFEAFNLTNRVNVVTVNGNFGSGTYPTQPSSTFGQATAVGEPRSLQLGLRFRF